MMDILFLVYAGFIFNEFQFEDLISVYLTCMNILLRAYSIRELYYRLL